MTVKDVEVQKTWRSRRDRRDGEPIEPTLAVPGSRHERAAKEVATDGATDGGAS